MDAINTGGLVVTVIGVSTVFTALITLSALVTFLARQSNGPRQSTEAATQPIAEVAAEGEAPSSQASEGKVDLERVALAAYALHRRHRIDRGSACEATGWVHAGRVRGTATYHR